MTLLIVSRKYNVHDIRKIIQRSKTIVQKLKSAEITNIT